MLHGRSVAATTSARHSTAVILRLQVVAPRQGCIRRADNHRSRGEAPPGPPPPPGPRFHNWENLKFEKGNIDLGYFLYTNFWVLDPPPPPSLLINTWPRAIRRCDSVGCRRTPGDAGARVAVWRARGMCGPLVNTRCGKQRQHAGCCRVLRAKQSQVTGSLADAGPRGQGAGSDPRPPMLTVRAHARNVGGSDLEPWVREWPVLTSRGSFSLHVRLTQKGT